jgi:hypothetical protein
MTRQTRRSVQIKCLAPLEIESDQLCVMTDSRVEGTVPASWSEGPSSTQGEALLKLPLWTNLASISGTVNDWSKGEMLQAFPLCGRWLCQRVRCCKDSLCVEDDCVTGGVVARIPLVWKMTGPRHRYHVICILISPHVGSPDAIMCMQIAKCHRSGRVSYTHSGYLVKIILTYIYNSHTNNCNNNDIVWESNKTSISQLLDNLHIKI